MPGRKEKRIYMAGGVEDLPPEEKYGWRSKLQRMLETYDMVGVDPTRGIFREEPPSLFNTREVVARNKQDILSCDGMVAEYRNYPRRAYIGTSMEVLFAFEHHIPVVVWAPETGIFNSWLEYHSVNWFSDLDDVVEYLVNYLSE